jgi:SAM-dependent methyltransferase
MLLDVLCSMELLDKQKGKYYLVPVADHYLVPGKSTYMGDYVLLDMGWEGFGQLADAIRTGKRPIGEDWTGERFAQLWVRRFAPRRLAPERGLDTFNTTWQNLGVKAEAGLRVLDIACGSGIRTLALAHQHPNVQVTLQELPPVLAVAVELAESLGVSQQVTALPGDLQEVDLGQNEFDLIFLGHIVHFFGPTEVVSLLHRAHAALVPGGKLIIADVIVDEDRLEADSALLAAIWLYGVSAAGDVFTFSEIAGYLEQAGFVDVTLIGTQGEDIVKARKP